MQSNLKRDFSSRSGGSNCIHMSGRIGRTPRVEYVNRSGERVSPTTGKPYDRKDSISSANGKLSKRRRSLPIKKSGAMFGGLDPIPTDVTRDPPPHTCFNCWQPGHSRRDCPRPSIARICNNCGRRGEDLRSCPRCKRAHMKYLERLQARERGENVEPEQIEAESVSQDEDYEDNEEIMRDIMYQDQRAKELIMFQENERESPYTDLNMTIYSSRDNDDDNVYVERKVNYPATEEELKEYLKEREQDSQPIFKPLPKSHDEEEPFFGQRIEKSYEEPRIDRPYYQTRSDKPYYEARSEKSYYESRSNKSLYESRSDKPYYESQSEKSYYEMQNNRERERESVFKDDSAQIDRATQELPSRNAIKYSMAATSSSTSDPVQDILLLAKTIAHLSPETQDLIMRQVIAERKEKARQRAMVFQERNDDDTWP